MKHNRIGLLRVALEAVSETAPAVETTLVVEPVVEGAPAETVAPEVPAGGNQDQAPGAGTDAAPASEPTEVVAAVAEAAVEEVAEEAAQDELDEVDLVEIFQDVGDLRVDGIELNDNAAELKQASVAVAELQDLADATEESGAVDKDTDAARVLLEVAVENIYNRLGIENPAIALEDAGGMGATVREKVRSIRDQVVRLLRTILEAVKKAYQRAMEYFRKVFETAARIEKAAISLRRSAEKAPMDVADKSLSNQRLKTLIGVSKGISLVNAFENLASLVDHAYQSANSGYIDYLGQIVDGFINDQNVERLMTDFPRVLKRSLDDRFSETSDFDIKGASADIQVLTSKLLPGEYVGVLRLPNTLASLREFDYDILRVDDPEYEDLLLLNKQELIWLCDVVIEITSTIRKFENRSKANSSLVSHLTGAIDAFERKEDVNLTAEDREFLKSLSAVAPVLAQGIHERTFAFAVSTTANALRYAELCIKQLPAAK